MEKKGGEPEEGHVNDARYPTVEIVDASGPAAGLLKVCVCVYYCSTYYSSTYYCSHMYPPPHMTHKYLLLQYLLLFKVVRDRV
jgi:hypothetical protein